MSKKKRIGIVSKLTATALLLSTMVSPAIPTNVKAATTTENTALLRILETTDLHSNVMPYDYYKDTTVKEYGLAKTATLIKEARSEVSNSMLFDAGDTIQGNPLASYVAKVNKLGPNDTHPIFKAMNYLDYDAGIVGNHEFNYGLDYLNDVLGEVEFPVVNANIYHDDATDDKNYFTPYKIIEKTIKTDAGTDAVVKVGVIGFAPPQIMQWDKDNLTGKVIAKDIVTEANKFIPKMKAEGAEIIVAIAHSGCDIAEEGQEAAENAVYDLTKVSGIDAMLFGHAHLKFPEDASFKDKAGIDQGKGTINGTQAVEAGFWGNNLGVLDLALTKDTDGKWIVDKTNEKTKSVNRSVVEATPVDQNIVNAVKAEHDGTLDYVRGKIGETSIPIHSYFTRVMDDASTQIVNAAQMDYVKNWINTNAPEYKDMPVLSAAAPFKGGRGGVNDFTSIAKGELTIKSAADLYLFDNTLKAVEVNGDQVKRWLEISASQFKTIDPNKTEPQELLDYDFRPYNFDVIDGVKYDIDVTKPVGQRIVNLTMMDGTPVKMDQKFIVATNNYRAGGSGGLPELKTAKVVVDSPFENRQILMDYITAQKTVTPAPDNNWKIAPVNGNVQLKFRSSNDPSAIAVANEAANLQPLGELKVGNDTYQEYSYDDGFVKAQLLGINDLHGQLDYTTKVNGEVVGGIEYLAAYLKQREALNPNTLMLHAGDAVGASRPVSALLQDEPTIRFLNEIGFDLGTIGNHEFDEGVGEMLRLINGGHHKNTGYFEGANFPYIAANVEYEKPKGKLVLDPYVIKEVEGKKIGFIGVITTETPSIVTASGVAGVKFTDEVEAINKYTAELKGKGVEAIVVLAHNPGTSATDGSNPTGEVVEFANAVDDEVDVIIGAHDHKYLNSTVDGKLLVQSYSYGTAFSDIDLAIDPATGEIVAKRAEIVSTFQKNITPDAKIKAELDGYLADIAPTIGEVVGEAAVEMTRTANEAGESALGNLIADSMRDATNSDFAFMNSGGIRDNLNKGPITWGELFAIQPFGNDVVTLTVTGEQIRTLLNQQFSADRNRIMAISGLKYTWSPEKPLGEKVLDIFLPNGKKIDPKANYTVAVNNFMADGGDGYTILKQGKDRKVWMTDLDALINYVKAQKQPISAAIEGRILFANDVTPDNPTTPENPSPAPVVTVKPVISGGKATIGAKDFATAVEKAVKDKAGLSIDLGKEQSVTVNLTKEQIAQLKEKGIPLFVNNDDVKLSIPLSILTAGKDFSVKLNRMANIKNAKSPVYEFNIIIDGKEIHQFAEPITLTFDVDASKVKNTKDLKVFYFNEKTKVWELVPGAIYNNGKVEVKTNHFSIFTVFEVPGDQTTLKETAPTPMNGKVLPNTATNSYNFLLFGILFVAFGLGLVVRRRRVQG